MNQFMIENYEFFNVIKIIILIIVCIIVVIAINEFLESDGSILKSLLITTLKVLIIASFVFSIIDVYTTNDKKEHELFIQEEFLVDKENVNLTNNSLNDILKGNIDYTIKEKK